MDVFFDQVFFLFLMFFTMSTEGIYGKEYHPIFLNIGGIGWELANQI